MKSKTFLGSSLIALLAACSGADSTSPAIASGSPDGGTSDGGPDGDAGAVVTPFGDDVPVSGTQNIKGLEGPVDVVRDKTGMVHIYATRAVDALRVEGYQVARDRTVQLELVRRSAEGSIAEIAGESSLPSDIATRTVGMKRVGQAMYDALAKDSEARLWLDAYADGISQFNARLQAKTEKLPAGMVGVPLTAFGPWTGADVLAIARLQAYALSYSIDDELAATELVQAAQSTFTAASADPAVAARANFLVDTVRFEALDPRTVLDAFPDDAKKKSHQAKRPKPDAQVPRVHVPSSVLSALAPWKQAVAQTRKLLGVYGKVGSNNWVVDGSITSTGHPLVASDPHLSLSAPAVFWMVHLDVVSADPKEQLDVAGLSFPGIPGIILGSNEHIAWGATDAYYDVSDAWNETLTPDGKSVVFNGKPVAIETIKEVIPLQGGKSYTYNVQVVPHHGPILPTIDPKTNAVIPAAGSAVSSHWTGQEATHDIESILGILRAKNVDDARTAFKDFATGAENWVVGDDQGNIFWTTQSNIPLRDKRAFTWDPASFSGTLPIFVLPGDGSAEWKGYLSEANVPHAKNPASHYIATANAQQVPRVAPNDPSSTELPDGTPIFLGAEYDPGLRVARIRDRIDAMVAAGHKISPDDMASIQGDTRSPFGARLTPVLINAIARAAEEKATPGTHPDLTAIVGDKRYSAATMAEVSAVLTAWGGKADYDAASGMDPTTNKAVADPDSAAEATAIFNAWFARIFGAIFGDELHAMGQDQALLDTGHAVTYLLTAPDPAAFATYSATTGDSILFDDMSTPSIIESRDERTIASLLDALDYLSKTLGADSKGWRWGALHTIRFSSLISLWGGYSIPSSTDKTFPNGFPRHGDNSTVDVGGFSVPFANAALPADMSFSYAHGPTQRFVADLDPKGLVVRNVLPGGEVWDTASPHFRDEAEMWRVNKNHPVAFAKSDVVAAAEEHVVYTSP